MPGNLSHEQYKHVERLIRDCNERDDLNDWETDFVDDMTNRLAKYKAKIYISDA